MSELEHEIIYNNSNQATEIEHNNLNQTIDTDLAHTNTPPIENPHSSQQFRK